eukprot:TRINITY_DN75736_c0_g1_i1.p1 TRINITY_DN75736_c0_g1~~TRINITY_DN75736_c0_g1_i1.p1  ORF type:complete len:1127 (+),score=156.89 TRINITY_DN75736_c0_g1_i1:360-3383(+)
MVQVRIGPSSDSQKCVTPRSPVTCHSDAGNRHRADGHADRFHIFNVGNQVCAKRIDHSGLWGLDLVIWCEPAKSSLDKGFWKSEKTKSCCKTDMFSLACPFDCSGSSHLMDEMGWSTSKKKWCCNNRGIGCDGSTPQAPSYLPHLQGPFNCKVEDLTEEERNRNGQGSIQSGDEGLGTVTVTIGSSDRPEKCVSVPDTGINCDESDIRGDSKWPDRFRIFRRDAQICAQRIDAESHWGLNLAVTCHRGHQGSWQGNGGSSSGSGYHGGSSNGQGYHGSVSFTIVTIGPSHSVTKCVNSPGNVLCDDHSAEQGRTGEYPDKFDVWHQGGQICVKRIDADSHWGMNLELHCRNKGNSGAGVWPSTNSRPRYDCHHGSREMWTQDKAQYCNLWLQAIDATSAAAGRPEGHDDTSYDCDQGIDATWSEDKRHWCKLHGGRHNCRSGHPSTWHQAKMDYCCILKGIGCPKEGSSSSSYDSDSYSEEYGNQDQTRNSWMEGYENDNPSAAAKPVHANSYDCLQGTTSEWSSLKRTFCCRRWGMGCLGSEASGGFDCSAGQWNWKKGWSDEKKAYCCKHDKKGCPGDPEEFGDEMTTPTSYDCDKDASLLVAAGREWCCKNKPSSKACPYDCHAGLSKWQTGFSEDKKNWCCKYQHLACSQHGEVVDQVADHGSTSPHGSLTGGEPYSFDDCRNKDDMSQGVVSWCCSHLGYCNLKVNFDCKAGEKRTWSSAKKDTCCGKEVSCEGYTPGSHSSSSSSHIGSEQESRGVPWYKRDSLFDVQVGPSETSIKCVTPLAPVFCPVEAGNVGRKDSHPDRFQVYRSGGKVCARRVDHDSRWGLDLVLKCTKIDGDSTFEQLVIGSSTSPTKCVSSPRRVTCDSHSAQQGRTDPHPDEFKVYQDNGMVCATRTDANAAWGLHLVLFCKKDTSQYSGFWRYPSSTSADRYLEERLQQKDEVEKSRLIGSSGSLAIFAFGATCAVLLGAAAFSAWRRGHKGPRWVEVDQECLADEQDQAAM